MKRIDCQNCNFQLEISEEMEDFKSTICPACNQKINLVDYFQNSSDLVTIFIAWNEMERISMKSLLESAGIKVHLKQINTRDLAGFGKPGSSYHTSTGPAEIQVAEKDAKKASELANEHVDQVSKNEKSDYGEEYDNVAVLFQTGTELFENGDFEQAGIKFDEALTLEPESQEILYNLTLVYIAQKKLDKAWKYVKKIHFEERSDLIKEIKKVEETIYEDFCPICTDFNENEGFCYRLKENISRYPKRFLKKCNGNLFKKDLTKYMNRVK